MGEQQTQQKRGVCPECGKERPMRNSGDFYQHQWTKPRGGIWCPGSFHGLRGVCRVCDVTDRTAKVVMVKHEDDIIPMKTCPGSGKPPREEKKP